MAQVINLATRVWQERVISENQARLFRYKRAWDAYFGRFPKPLKVRQGKPDDNVIVNYCRVVADLSVAFLFGREPRFELDETADTDAEVWLRDAWRYNRKMILLQKMALNGAVCGHVFVKILPGEPFPKLINLSPEYVHVITDPEDIDLVVRYVIEFPAVSPDGTAITRRQTIERVGESASQQGRWHITEQEARGSGPYRTLSETDWPWPWPPIVDCQNLPSPNEYYGIADIEEDLVDINESINFVLSNMARIIRYHAHPKTWGRGFDARQLQIAVDETIVLPGEDAELRNLEMESDLESSIRLYERLREALHEVSRTPEVATGKLERAGALSGVALQILYQPLIDKIEAKRLTYGEMLVELNRRLLEMGGFGPDNVVTIHWPELLPKDVMAERQAALIDQQLGVSQDTILQRLGFDPELERQKRELSSADMAERMLEAFNRGE
ncbi:MAG: phage portal protein [Chloroflexi bacterium]|nr:phage portal protein [Chloroflexota bacterium]